METYSLQSSALHSTNKEEDGVGSPFSISGMPKPLVPFVSFFFRMNRIVSALLAAGGDLNGDKESVRPSVA